MKKHFRLVAALALALAAVPGLGAQARLSDYRVGPQDVLQISVYEEPGMSSRYRVDSDGSIAFPLLNRVAVGGLTTTEIESKLKTELIKRDIMKQPQINVDVAEFRSRRVWIIGAVRAPNEYRLIGDMSLIAALAQAGGPNEGASNEISIMRPKAGQPQGALSPDARQDADVTIVKLNELLTGDGGANISLQDGDTIYVPVAEKFYITGYVKNVGPYVYQRGLTVQQALTLAGGITELGSDKRITIERMVNNKKKTIKAKLTDPVLPADTIKVDRRRF